MYDQLTPEERKERWEKITDQPFGTPHPDRKYYHKYTIHYWAAWDIGGDPEVREVAIKKRRHEILGEHIKRLRDRESWNHFTADFLAWEEEEKISGAQVNVSNNRWDEYINFSGYHFPHMNFSGAEFHKEVNFRGAQFHQWADFRSAQFDKGAYFHETQFHRGASFHETQFHRGAGFRGAQFHQWANFSATQFQQVTFFHETQFHQGAFFQGVQFQQSVEFSNTRHEKNSIFKDSVFKAAAYFKGAVFKGKANFQNVNFEHEADFNQAAFKEVPDFNYAHFRQPPYLSEMDIPWRQENEPEDEGKEANYRRNIHRYRRLKLLAQQAGDFEKELQFSGYEMRCRIHDKATPKRLKCILKLYHWVSDFGQSIWRPVGGLLILCLLGSFAMCTTSISRIDQRYGHCAVSSDIDCVSPSLARSAHKTLILPIFDKTHLYELESQLYGQDERGKNRPVPGVQRFFDFIQTLSALPLVFLLGLGIRNRLRLR